MQPATQTAKPLGIVMHVGALIRLLLRSAGRLRLLFLGVVIIAVIALTAIMQLRLNAWNQPFFDAIERKNINVFVDQLLIFAVIASILLILNVAQTWLDETLKVETRKWLTYDLLRNWLAPRRAFLIAGAGEIGINPDQRIHEDARRLTELSVSLAIGLFQSALLLLSFVGVLWLLSEDFTLLVGGHEYRIPGFMVWCALIYAASGSCLSWLIGRPLVDIGQARAAQEADLRFALVRVSEAADGIALCSGEEDERQHLTSELDKVISLMRQFVGRVTELKWVTAGYGWLAIVAPIVVAVPGYFWGQLTFGELMMTVGAFNQVQQSLRWFVDNLSMIADWQAALLRVMNFRDMVLSIDKVDPMRPRINIAEGEDALTFDNLAVSVAGREVGLDKEVVKIRPGERALIIGKSGIGKSLFFRAIAGLWSWGKGGLKVPTRADVMFLPQRSYVPVGTLRHVLTYPVDSAKFSEDDLVFTLHRASLSHLVPLLDTLMRWDKELTANERLHLSLARVLVHRPKWVISDEVLGHLNEDDRRLAFSLFEKDMPETAVVSITSDDTVHPFYSRVLHLTSIPVPEVDAGSTVEKEIQEAGRSTTHCR